MKIIFTAAIFFSLQFCAGTEIKTKTAEYKQDSKDYEGYFAEPANLKGKVPGVLLIHEWTGLGDHVKGRANQTAALGYVSFAMDMYGKGIRVEDHDHEKAGK
ncbi:MAG TPA: dienelactone hydrolase family protein, partial [Leptospiraceae bacterium]|nr:dienelactone hydrolase family protein [Leptospiraceae bacterium]